MVKGKPFVKWAGGKRQIMSEIKKYIPDEFNDYYEPFVGGGAVFFELFNSYGMTAFLNDYNKEIINVYECLKDENKFEKVCKELDNHEANHSEDYYYEIRRLNKDKKIFSKLSDCKRAARTIYLNKACFNGLYRVNRNNEFNVPFGKKNKVNTYDGQNLGIVHCILNFNKVSFSSSDFEVSFA
jgi:DNA adenine methylase